MLALSLLITVLAAPAMAQYPSSAPSTGKPPTSAPQRPPAKPGETPNATDPLSGVRTGPARRTPPRPLTPEETRIRDEDTDRAQLSQCAHVGRRVIGLLARDDVGAANEFYHFYTSFDCPGRFLAAAFGCVVETIPADGVAPSLANVEACWRDPYHFLTRPEEVPVDKKPKATN